MVTFSVTFVLALPHIEEKHKQKKQREENPIKTENINSENNINDSQEIKKIYDVGKPQTCFHIEYFLTSDANKFEIDINCWENAAKVSTLY